MTERERGAGRARLAIVTGLPGAGKTTLAQRLAETMPAARMCPDEWMTSAGLDLWDSDARRLIERTQQSVAIEMLRGGRNVVVEFGSWSRAGRDALRDAAREVGADVELRYVTAPIDELWRRISDKGPDSQFGARSIREDELAAWASWFDVPTAEEFAEYDRPFDAPD